MYNSNSHGSIKHTCWVLKVCSILVSSNLRALHVSMQPLRIWVFLTMFLTSRNIDRYYYYMCRLRSLKNLWLELLKELIFLLLDWDISLESSNKWHWDVSCNGMFGMFYALGHWDFSCTNGIQNCLLEHL